ncbi:MAG TPA: SAM-dependent methyltransferase [Pyrinomonadaceae bacterium]|nr:SAM-dependent methyltransferase [Pyrinomonadaceae bacterium]
MKALVSICDAVSAIVLTFPQPMLENVEKFVDSLQNSLADGSFVRLTLGNYKGADEHLQKIHARRVATKKGDRLFLLYRFETRDTAKNYDVSEARDLIGKLIDSGFRSGHLFTTSQDLQLDIGKKGKSRLNAAKPTFKTAPSTSHDRKKQQQIDPSAFYLRALGITTDEGKVREKQHDKWRQINKFVEILAGLVDKSELKDRKELKVLDMGSGKGYLTFATYDYFANIRGVDVDATGVEARADLVKTCNDVADASGFEKLRFVQGTIADHNAGDVDILIALHACNTATDDAIFKGIRSKADVIIAVPCCHHELRPQIKPPAMLQNVLKHSILLERIAETITDGIRSLLLEREGYATKLFEFVAVEHTPKNNMLVATRSTKGGNGPRLQQELNAIKDLYGIQRHHLEELLDKGMESYEIQRHNA